MATFGEKLNRGLQKLTGRYSGEAFDKPFPFHVEIKRDAFVRLKVIGLYKRILSSCIKRTIFSAPNKNDIERSFYDCFENSENNSGLVSFISKGLYEKKVKVLVFTKKTGILREATKDEEKEINADYKTIAKSSKGIVINFKDYELTDILRHYYCQMYEMNCSRSTALNVASSLKIAISKLREMVSKQDAEVAISQARNIADALKNGNSVLIDADDKVDAMSSVDVEPQIVARNAIYSEVAEQTGLPVSFISGEPTTGASLIGDADINREADAIEEYWLAIWEPIIKNLYGIVGAKYRREKWRALESKVRSVSIVESLDTLSEEEKRALAVEILELEDAESDKKKES